jgi:hypothetical protein
MTDDDRSLSDVFGLDDRTLAERLELDADPLRGDPATPLDVERLHGERWHVDAYVSEAFTIDEDGVLHDHRDHAFCPECAPREETGEAFVAIIRPGDPVVGDPAQANSPINQAIRAAVRKARGFMPGGNDRA